MSSAIRPTAARQPRARSFAFNPAEAVARVGTIAAPQLLYAAGLAGGPVAGDCPRRSTIHSVLRPRSSRCCSTVTRRVRRDQLAWLDQYAHPAVVRQMRADSAGGDEACARGAVAAG